MDDKDDDKKRVLTPPSEWADGMKPKSPSEAEKIDENKDWLEDDELEVSPESEDSGHAEPSAGDEASATVAPEPGQSFSSDADAVLTDHDEAQAGKASGSKLPWVVAIAGFVVAGGIGELWFDARGNAKAEITELKDTIRSMKRAENKQFNQSSRLIADNEALQQQITALQQQNNQLADENEELKNREVERAQRRVSVATTTDAETTTATPSQMGGPWFINLESYRSPAVANERLSLLRTKVRSINLSIASAKVNGQTYYRVRAAGYASKTDATVASKWIAQRLTAGPFWVGKDSEKNPDAH